MATYYIYSKFSAYDSDGFSFHIFNEDDKSTFDNCDDYTFVQEIELDPVSQEEVVKAGVKAIDNEIAELQMKITQQEEKKQQLLAITYQEA